MSNGSSELSQIEEAVIRYISQWMRTGAPDHHPRVAEALGQAMPQAAHVELFCLSRVRQELSVYCVQYPATHEELPNMWHSFSLAPTLALFFGAGNEAKIKTTKGWEWYKAVICQAKQDKFLWEAPSMLNRMVRCILRNEDLGLSDEQIAALTKRGSHISGAGHAFVWTPGGGISAEIVCLYFATSAKIKGKGAWFSVGDIKGMAEKGEFVKYQALLLDKAVAVYRN